MRKFERKNDALIVFVRHGQSEVNVEGLMSSARDVGSLTDIGKAQAQAIAIELKKLKVDRIVSSPVIRARQTAQIISVELGNISVEEDIRLAERGFGELEGKHVNGYTWRFEKDSGIEDFEMLATRVKSFMDDIERGVIVAVTHGDTMRAPALKILGLDESSGFGLRAYNANLGIIQANKGWVALIGFGMPILNEDIMKRIPERFRN